MFDILVAIEILLAILFLLNNKNNKNIIYYLSSSLILLIMCFHDGYGNHKGISNDFPEYIGFFTGRGSMYGNIELNVSEYGLELPYYYFCKFLRLFGSSEILYIVAYGIMSTFPILLLIKKYSENSALSILLLFVLMNGYTFLFLYAAHRQMIANSCFLLTWFIVENENIKYIIKYVIAGILLLVAIWAHSTSYIIFPVLIVLYFLSKYSNVVCFSRKTAISFVMGSLIIGTLLQRFWGDYFSLFMISLGDFDEIARSTHYFIDDVYESKKIVFRAVSPLSFLACFFLYKSDDTELHSFPTLCFLAATVGYNLFSSVPLFDRSITTLLIIGAVAAIPRYYMEGRNTERYLLLILVLFMIRETMKLYNNGSLGYYPVTFWWE